MKKEGILPQIGRGLAAYTTAWRPCRGQLLNIGMSRKISSKLGTLLLEAGLINNEDFRRAVHRAASTGLPLGRVLVLHGNLSEPQLIMALEIEKRVRDGVIPREEATKSMRSVNETAATLDSEEALTFARAFEAAPPSKKIRIGELLNLSGLISDADLLSALEISLEEQLPIGQAIIMKGYASSDTVEFALEIQRMVVDSRLDLGSAAELLAAREHTRFRQSAADQLTTKEYTTFRQTQSDPRQMQADPRQTQADPRPTQSDSRKTKEDTSVQQSQVAYVYFPDFGA